MKLSQKQIRLLLLLAGGLLTGLTLIFPKVGFLEWLTLVPTALFLLSVAPDKTVRLRRLYGYGLFFFYCYYLTTFHWFVNLYPLSFIDGMTKGAALAVVLVAWLGLSLLQALMGGLLFVLVGLLFRSRVLCRAPLLRPFGVAVAWSVYEWTQTLGWWGVPWGRLALGQAEYPIGLQVASLFGPYFVTFSLVSVNFCVAYAILAYRKKERPAVKASALFAVILLCLEYGLGIALWVAPKESEETVKVAVVQGNISSHEKWDASTTQKTKDVYRSYTLKAASEGAEIVVWPETALPYTVSQRNNLGKFVSSVAKEANVTVLVGCFTHDDEGEYNSIACFLPDGQMSETVYSKRRLVPFGEFVPLRGLIETIIPPLAELVLSGEDVTEGEGANLFELEQGKIGSLICFDSIYEDLTRESVLEGATLIALSTNDSWFTDSAALYMHNAQAQLRAIENGRYVVRSANTGISTVISPRGEVLESLEPLVDGMIVHEVEMREETTLYTKIGNLFVYVGIVAMVVLGVYEVIIRKIKRKNREND